MDNNMNLDFLKRLARGIVHHFGKNCEIVIHDLKADSLHKTIIEIENGHVTNRKIGDGASHIVLNTINKEEDKLDDSIGYLTKTHDGRVLKSSSIYIRDEDDEPIGIFCINYDITELTIAENSIKSLLNHKEEKKEVEEIPQNVNDLLDNLIDQSVKLIGKPVALMSKEDKIKSIQYLNNAGAFLITKSGDKISKYFGISKYSIYNYIDVKR
ncbi:helix-turn-helix transcriptional regulator [Vallitalea sediminicola]